MSRPASSLETSPAKDKGKRAVQPVEGSKLSRMISDLEQFLYCPIEELAVAPMGRSHGRRIRKMVQRRQKEGMSRKEHKMEAVFNAISSHFE